MWCRETGVGRGGGGWGPGGVALSALLSQHQGPLAAPASAQRPLQAQASPADALPEGLKASVLIHPFTQQRAGILSFYQGTLGGPNDTKPLC